MSSLVLGKPQAFFHRISGQDCE